MKQSRYKLQYDKGAYLKCVLKQRWNATVNPSRFRSDQDRLKRINTLAPKLENASEEQIREQVTTWKQRLADEKITQDEIIEPAFAMLREASRRTTGLFHYDEQILGGLALARGGVAEMATGEGKTLGVSLPTFIFSLHGRGVHVMTVNSYLSERDYEFSKPIFDFLGITIAFLPEGGENAEKREAYAQEITYGVGYEFGFDYMRDQLALMRHPKGGPGEELRLAILGEEKAPPDICQRGLAYAIIDEVDSVLIDEAGSPLLISEQSAVKGDSTEAFLRARDQARSLRKDDDFEVDLNKRSIELTEKGKREIFDASGRVPWEKLRRPWETYVMNALKAEHLFERDVHYLVDDNKVMIVDEFTGRRFEDRSWREGQHQAVEAKEDVEIRPESDSAASITRQRYFALYDTICGLTGTAAEGAGEFWRFFKMPVASIPLHNPSLRNIETERVFKDRKSMYQAVTEDIIARQSSGQPILVGTRTIRDSEAISELLTEKGAQHLVLTAKQDEEEEEIISNAGESRSVIIATNMAGRGTHIGLSDEAKAAGGLHVICIERNESTRIDRQLVGRGARNGQPGSAQSFVSAEDYIIQTYAPAIEETLKNARANAEGELSKRHSKYFDQTQAAVEVIRYDQRVKMAEHDKWMEETKETLAT